MNSRQVSTGGAPKIILNPRRSWFSAILPADLDLLNKVPDGSFELGISGWTGSSATLLWDTAKAFHGSHSLKASIAAFGTWNTYYTITIPFLNGVKTICGFEFWGTSGLAFSAYPTSSGNTPVATAFPFTGQGKWQHVWFPFTDSSSVNRGFVITGTAPTASAFWVDGLYIYDGSIDYGYFDGYDRGLVADDRAFFWMGLPRQSASLAKRHSRAIGSLVNFKDYGFDITGVVGLSSAPHSVYDGQLGSLDGSVFNNVSINARPFTLIGMITGRTPHEFAQNKNRLVKLLGGEQSIPRSPIRLRFQDLVGLVLKGSPAEIQASYVSGLEGTLENLYREDVAIQFVAHDPFLRGVNNNSTPLTVVDSIGTVRNILRRTRTGWDNLTAGTNVGGAVYAIHQGRDGKIYVGGTFTGIGGLTAANIAVFDPLLSTWANVNGVTGVNGDVLTIVDSWANGKVVRIGGNFTNAGGDGFADYVADVLNGGVGITSVGGVQGADLTVQKLVNTTSDITWMIGNFANVGGIAAAKIAWFDGTNWNAVGTGVTGGVPYEIAWAPDGKLWIAGSHTGFNGTTVGLINTYDPIAGTIGTLGGGVTSGSLVSALWPSADGYTYIAGTLTVIGGVTVSNGARWNGGAWESIPSTPRPSYAIAETPNGELLFGGYEDLSGTLGPIAVRRLRGKAWTNLDVGVAAAGFVTTYEILVAGNGDIYVGGISLEGSAYGGHVSDIAQGGNSNAPTYPIIEIAGPGNLTSIINEENNNELQFIGLSLATGEIIRIEVRRSGLSIISNYRGSVVGYLVGNTDSTGFTLVPGNNHLRIGVLASSGSPVGSMYWKRAYQNIEAPIYE